MDPYGYSAEWLAQACGVDLSTARRWKRLAFIPRRYARLVTLADSCDLGIISASWSGWKLTRDELVSPEGERFAIGQVRALPLKEQLASELERRLARIMETTPRRPARELVLRVRLDDELEGPAAGVATVVALETHPDSPS